MSSGIATSGSSVLVLVMMMGNFEIAKWSTSQERAINILFYCIKIEFIGNLGMELSEDISTLPCARSMSGDDVSGNNFKSTTYYSF